MYVAKIEFDILTKFQKCMCCYAIQIQKHCVIKELFWFML